MIITCEHNSCMKELTLADFKRRDVYPCCGKAIGQTINWPVLEPEPEVYEPVVVEQPKPPAKKKTSTAKKAKKAKK